MTFFDELQMFYKVKAGKEVYLMTPRPKDSRVLDRDTEQLEADMEKGQRGPLLHDDPFAMATAAMIKRGCKGGDPTGPPWGQGDFAKPDGKCTAARDKLAAAIAAKMGGGAKGKAKATAAPTAAPSRAAPPSGLEARMRGGGRGAASAVPMAAMLKAVDDLTFEQDVYTILKDGCGCSDTIDIEKVSDQLATLMSAAAGWALSGDVTRGKDAHLEREWERHHQERQERERREEERRHDRSRRRMRKSESFLDFANFLLKDHAPVPPRQGLLWDAVKHRWTRPENVGRTVTEVQGSKRFRGTGTGVHERRVGGHGRGSIRGIQAGRRFRGVTDVGHQRPHETTHPSRRGVKSIRSKGHKRSYLSILRNQRNKAKQSRGRK